MDGWFSLWKILLKWFKMNDFSPISGNHQVAWRPWHELKLWKTFCSTLSVWLGGGQYLSWGWITAQTWSGECRAWCCTVFSGWVVISRVSHYDTWSPNMSQMLSLFKKRQPLAHGRPVVDIIPLRWCLGCRPHSSARMIYGNRWHFDGWSANPQTCCPNFFNACSFINHHVLERCPDSPHFASSFTHVTVIYSDVVWIETSNRYAYSTLEISTRF